MAEEPAVTRRQVFLAGTRRMLGVLALLSAAVTVAALLVVEFSDKEASRVFPLAFYLGGGLIAIGGFLGTTMGPLPVGFPQTGALIREQGYHSAEEHQRATSNAVVYGVFGAALIVVGLLLDAAL